MPPRKGGRGQRLPKAVWRDQWERFLTACRRQRDRTLIAVLLWGGLRVSEACALDWRDVDFDRERLHVRHGKGDKEAYVYVAAHALTELRLLREEQEAPAREAPIFTTDRGRLSRVQAWRVVKAAALEAGIGFETEEGFRAAFPHACRHGCATAMIENGEDLATVRDHLRHSSVAVTDIYTHVANPRLRRAASRL